MKTEILNNRFNKLSGLAVLFVLSLAVTGCFEGYIGPDGEHLLEYLPPEKLYELVQEPDPDIWLIDVDLTDLVLCGGHRSSNADSATGPDGTTTMSLTTLAAGGCTDGVAVVIQGFVIVDPENCSVYQEHPIAVRSPDLDGSLTVDVVDLALFSMHFPPQAYDSCCDFDLNGVIDLVDLARFAQHFGPPGHSCF